MIKGAVKDFAENTTAHGVGRVASSARLWLRILWGCILLGTLSSCIYQVYLLLDLFFQRPVLIQRQVIFDDLEFPAVSFCNLNPIRTSQLGLSSGFNLTELIEQFDESATMQLSGTGSGNRRKKRSIDTHSATKIEEHKHIDLYTNNSYNHEHLENKRPQLNMLDFSLIDPWGDYEDQQIVEIAFDPVLSRQKRDGCSSPFVSFYDFLQEAWVCLYVEHGLSNSDMNVTRAQYACSLPSTSLVSIRYTEKYEAVQNVSHIVCTGCTGLAWIGLKTNGTGSYFFYNSNSSTLFDPFDSANSDFVLWAPDEPGPSVNECGLLNTTSWEWIMDDCNADIAYPLCERNDGPFGTGGGFPRESTPPPGSTTASTTTPSATTTPTGSTLGTTLTGTTTTPQGTTTADLCSMLRPCRNFGTCVNGGGSYTCHCLAGFTGTDCETGIDECTSGPCQNQGTCVDATNGYTCTCSGGYTGVHCETNFDECGSSPCLNLGACVDGLDFYICVCASGYTGLHCETETNECGSNPCLHLGTCLDSIDGYTCTCLNGYSGIHCETELDECGSSPCQNGGVCVDAVNMYTCTCPGGYTGLHCEDDIDECGSAPCQNSGICTDAVNFYTCQCLTGFTGLHCENEIDECGSSPCQNGGICTDAVNMYTCSCSTAYTGLHCENEVDECGSSPCQNGGICDDAVNMYTCSCPGGFTGLHCEDDIDECTTSPCLNQGSCFNGFGSYVCQCTDGYTGSHCESEIYECISNPCQNDGICSDGIDGYTCSCILFFTGVHCESIIAIDACDPNPCQNSASCRNTAFGYECSCGVGYTGFNCETNIDECSSSPCQNSGTCNDIVNGYICVCDADFAGTHCESVAQADDPIDEVYVPVPSLDELPWFGNTEGEVSAEVGNSEDLTSALYEQPIDTRRQMGTQLQDLMQECTWNGRVCTPLNITGFMSRKYGNCFTFNSGAFSSKLKQRRPGQSYGLSLTLFIDESEYIFSVTPSPGARVLIHKQNSFPFMEEDGFNVNVGQRSSVKLREVQYRRLGPPWGKCTKGKKFDLYYSASYTVKACLKTCYQKETLRDCHCADDTLAVPNNRSTCATDSELECLARVKRHIEHGDVKCKCPELCKDTQYRQSVSSSEWPGDTLIEILNTTFAGRSDALDAAMVDEESIRRNLLKIDVFFEDLQYDLVVEMEAYGVSQLLGDIGGQLGLWIGVSVLTLIEFCQFLMELVTMCVQRAKNKNGVGAQGADAEKKPAANGPVVESQGEKAGIPT